MKKAVLSPLCSALVIPGLGQVINQHLKKGVLILAIVFVLLVMFIVQLYQVVTNVLASGGTSNGDPVLLMERIRAENPTSLYWIFAAFCAVWVYAVIDAFVGGLRKDKAES